MRSRSIPRLGAAGPLATAVLAAIVLAACSSTPSASPARGTTTSAPKSTTSTAATTSTTSSSATSTAVAPPACTASGLHLAEDGAKSTAGAGSADIAYTLTNAGATPCLVEGYPAVTFYGPSGTAGGTTAALSLSTVKSGPAPQPVALDAGAAGAFYLVVSNVPSNGAACTNVGSIAVTPPGASAALTLTASLQPCGPSVGVTAVVPLSSLST